MKPHIIAALKHRGKEARFSVCDFIGKATMYRKKAIKKQVKELMDDRGIAPLLGNCAMSDKEATVKVAGCMAMHGLDDVGIMKLKKANKDLVNQWDQLKNNKRGKKNLEKAQAEYAKLRAAIDPKDAGEDEAEKKKEQEKKGKGKEKGKGTGGIHIIFVQLHLNIFCGLYMYVAKGGGGDGGQKAAEPKKAAPVQAANTGGGAAPLGDDEKEENGKRYKKVVKKITKERPKEGMQ